MMKTKQCARCRSTIAAHRKYCAACRLDVDREYERDRRRRKREREREREAAAAPAAPAWPEPKKQERPPDLIDRRRKRRPPAVQIVYFLTCLRGSGLWKIGTTNTRGAKNLWVGYQGAPIVSFPGGVAEETALHERFAESRVIGEWFRPTPELEALTEQIKATATERDGLLIGEPPAR